MSQSTWTARSVPRTERPPDARLAPYSRCVADHRSDHLRAIDSGHTDCEPVPHRTPSKYFKPFSHPPLQSRQTLLGETRMHETAIAVKPRRHFGARHFGAFVWMLFLSSLFGVLSVKSAHAQATFTLTPVGPQLSTSTPRIGLVPEDTKTAAEESTSVNYNITLTGAVANTTYRVTVQTADGTEFLSPFDPLLNDNGPDAGRTARGESNDNFDFNPRFNAPPTVFPNNVPPYFYPNDYLITPLDATNSTIRRSTLTFTGNETQTVTIRVIDDKDYEAIQPNDPVTLNQSFIVRLTGESAVLDGNPAPIVVRSDRNDSRHFIIDNDPRPDIGVAPVSIDPFDNPNTFPSDDQPTINAFREQNSGISRNGVTIFLSARNEVDDINFNYSFSSGISLNPATEGTDFNNTAGQAVFRRGETVPRDPANLNNATPVSVDIRGDIDEEADEDIRVILSNAATARVATVQGTVVILDDDAPSATISDVSVIEPDNGQTSEAVFRIDLSSSSFQTINILYAANPIGANPAQEVPITNRVQDYRDPGNNNLVNVQFTPGQTTQFIRIPILGDEVDENDETFEIRLQRGANTRGVVFLNAQGNTDNQGIGTIVDNDRPVFRLGVPLSITEPVNGQTTLNFPVTLDQPSERLLTIRASTQDNTATQPQDYDANSQVLTFDPGVAGDITQPPQQTQFFQVNINSDTVDEIDESFFVNLSNPNAADALIAVGQTTGTIIDDDGPRIRIDDVIGNEGNAGTTVFTFTVSLRDASGNVTTSPQQITVAYRTQDVSAVSGGVNPDFQAQSGTLTFAPGVSTQTIRINVIGNTTFEAATLETFEVILSAPTNADPNTPFTATDTTPDRATGTIREDDNPPVITIDDPSVREGGGAQFTIRLSNPSESPIVVNFATSDGSARATADPAVPGTPDYTQTQGSVTFSPAAVGVPAETVKTVTVPTTSDAVDEANETFNLNLSLASGNANFGNPVDTQGTATIIDDDARSVSISSPPAITEGDSGTTNLTFTVSISGTQPNAQAITVNYTVTPGSATSPGDFSGPLTGTVTIPAGSTSATITVPIVGDMINEATETFTVTITTPDPLVATVVQGTATGTIVDNDSASLSFANANVSVTEGNSGNVNALFTVNLSRASDQQVTVNFTVTAGTAIAGTDFQSTSGTLTFAPRDTSETISVPVIGDTLDEENETFTVTLSSPGPAGITISPSGGTATGTIIDDDGDASLSVSDAQVIEGNSGSVNAVFTITLAPASGRTVTVNYATAPGTATSPADFQSTSGTETFVAGETSKTVTVAVQGDTIDEINETFLLQLTNATNAVVGDAQGLGTIIDDDGPAISIADTTVNEAAGTATFTLSLSAPSPQAITVNFATANGTATSGSDFTSTTGTVTFAANQTTRTFTVPILNDSVDEGPNTAAAGETFVVNLSSPTNATIGDGQGIATIIDDDNPPGISIGDVTITEGDSGTVNAIFTVRLSASSPQTVTVEFATSDGTATQGSDYVANAGTLTFAPGQVSQTITVVVRGDILDEANETFTVTLSNASNGMLNSSQASATGTITDDDVATLTLILSDDTVAEGGTITGTVSRNTDATQALAVTLTTSDATEATVPAQVTIPAGATSVEFTITAPVEEIIDGSQAVTISASADGFVAANARLIVTDVIPARLSLTINPDVIQESGGATAATATISRTVGFDTDLTVTITNSNPRRVTAPGSVIIPAGSSSATFTVRAINDRTASGTQGATFTASAANFASAAATVSVRDDDVAGIAVTPTRGLRTTEEGGTATFTIRLTSRPTADVTIDLQVGTPSEARLAVSRVTIRPDQFDTNNERVITVIGVNDKVADGDRSYIIITKPARSADPVYNGRNAADVTAVNIDNEVPGFNITPLTLRTTEASGIRSVQTFSVSLKASPPVGTSVSIGLTSSDPTEGKVSPQALRFTAANFNRPQTVTVTAVDDRESDGNIAYRIITSAAKAPGSAYEGINPPDINVTNEDNDDNTTPRVVITSPQANASVRSILLFTGTATDPGPAIVERVFGVLSRTLADGRREYFNANGVASTTVQRLTASGTERFRFLLTLAPGRVLPQGRYIFEVTAVDTAGNEGRSSVNFTINNQPPTIVITSPRNNSRVRNADNISGTVRVAGGLGTIQSVAVVIRQGTTVVKRLTAVVSDETFTSAAVGSLPDGEYTAEATATDNAGNTTTTTTTFRLDRTAPAGVAITSPANGAEVNDIEVIRGTASDVGTGLERVELVIRRRSDNTYFNGRAFVQRPNGTDGQPGAEPTVRATLSGNTFSYSLPGGLPADPDPLNALYSITAIAYDTAGNRTSSSQVTVRLNPDADGGDGETPDTPATSNVRLSSVSVKASDASIVLAFTGNLNGDSARTASLYNVMVNGQRVDLESVSFRAVEGRVVLTLEEGAIKIGDAVSVSFTNLLDASGKTVAGQATVTTR